MLTVHALHIGYANYAFKANGLTLTTRMTVVRLSRGHLWLFSPIPIAPKQPDLPAPDTGRWCPELDHMLFQGIPRANETDWFHAPSGTLVLTEQFQSIQGDLPLATKL